MARVSAFALIGSLICFFTNAAPAVARKGTFSDAVNGMPTLLVVLMIACIPAFSTVMLPDICK